MTLKKYWQKFLSVTIFYHGGCMLISQTVDFLNIHENLHRLIMEIKLSSQLSQGNERRLKIRSNHLMEDTWGYNRLHHTMLQHGHFDLENRV
jgi:hypothetical protein